MKHTATKDPEYSKKRAKLYIEDNNEKVKIYNQSPARQYASRKFTLKQYGLTPEDYTEMFILQEGKCFICKRESKSQNLHVDHDHKTGKVRKLLCVLCNSGLGKFRDDPSLLVAAFKYLKEYK